MLKVWDSGSQVYRDAESVRRYDAEISAWIDCKAGMAQKEGIWEEVWPDRKILYLYNAGDECKDITGGWGAEGYTFPNYPISSGTKNTDSMYVCGTRMIHMDVLGTLHKIDLTGYKEIHVDVSATCNESGGANMEICTEKALNLASKGVDFLGITDHDYVIDIQEIAGEHYICFSASNDARRAATIYKVWLE